MPAKKSRKRTSNLTSTMTSPPIPPITAQFTFAPITGSGPSIYSINHLSHRHTPMGNDKKHVHARGTLEKGDAFMLLFPTRNFTKALSHSALRFPLSVHCGTLDTHPIFYLPAKAIRQIFSCISFRAPRVANNSPQSACPRVLGCLGSRKAVPTSVYLL